MTLVTRTSAVTLAFAAALSMSACSTNEAAPARTSDILTSTTSVPSSTASAAGGQTSSKAGSTASKVTPHDATTVTPDTKAATSPATDSPADDGPTGEGGTYGPASPTPAPPATDADKPFLNRVSSVVSGKNISNEELVYAGKNVCREFSTMSTKDTIDRQVNNISVVSYGLPLDQGKQFVSAAMESYCAKDAATVKAKGWLK